MENGEAVNEESAPSVEEAMLSALSEEDVNEESSPSVPSDDTAEDSGSDTEEVEAREEQKEELIPKSSFTRRINGLQAAKRKAESKSTQLEARLAQTESVLRELKERYDNRSARLSAYEEQDPRDAQIEQLRFQQAQAERLRAYKDDAHQRQLQAHREEAVGSRADEIVAEADGLAGKYKTFSPEELVIGYSKTDGVSMAELASDLHKQRVNAYKIILAQNGSTSAPKPMRTQGSRSAIAGHSHDDMVRFLDTLGE
ncbi:MAG: hypothetical protein Unbinned4336contig1001_7 [Prokaryotic dsDNA virus sp.]|nr:MAG: hypothetical protein Unbinned4336contig1001_7 [Prokaryotic dsDNA virus sp.]|tara:strand:- start:1648 stop:2415 length:768 start_codon:yes stop_codon:yes gene_type:complete